MTAWAPPDKRSPIIWQPSWRRTARASSSAGDDVVGAEPAGLALLVRVAGADDDASRRARSGRGRRSPPGPSCRRRARRRPGRRPCATDSLRAASSAAWMPPASGSIEHRPLVGHVVAEAVQLALVGDELGRPAAAGRAAEAGLDAGLEVAGGEVAVVVAVAGGGAGERRGEAAGGVAEHRLEDDRGCRRRARRRPRGRARTGS